MPPFGWNTARPGADLVGEREEVELDTELAVVALLGLLEPVQVLGERVLALPRGAVDALELGRFSSPRQYAPATCVSLNAPSLPVDGTCGPRHRST